MALRGINASDLAEASGLTPPTVSYIRRGQAGVRAATMAKLAEGLAKFPILDGVEPLLAAPTEKAPDANGHKPRIKRVRRRLRPLRPNEGIPPEFVGRWRVIEEKS